MRNVAAHASEPLSELLLLGREQLAHRAGRHAVSGAPGDSSERAEVAGEQFAGPEREWLVLGLVSLQVRSRPFEQQPPGLVGAAGEGDAQRLDLPGARAKRRDRGGQLDGAIAVGARQGQQVLHGGVGYELAGAHQLLDGVGQRANQPEPAAHPAAASVEALSQLLDAELEPLPQLVQQPPLLEGAVALGVAHEPSEKQGLVLGQLPADGAHQVLAKPLQGTNAFVAVDEHVSTVLGGHHHDGKLLAVPRQRGEHPLVTRRTGGA